MRLRRCLEPPIFAAATPRRRALLHAALSGASNVLDTATLHKPHMATQSHDACVQANEAGTLALLGDTVAARVGRFVFTSTTSAFGSGLTPSAGEPAAWVTEDVSPVPKNIYGVTKSAAERLCELFVRRKGLPLVVLLTPRFFTQRDHDRSLRIPKSRIAVRRT